MENTKKVKCSKKLTSIAFKEELFKQAKKRAIDLGVSLTAYLENLIVKDIVVTETPKKQK